MLLAYPFPGPFDYSVPPGLDVEPGDLVLVPLNKREEVGVVWDGPADGQVGDNRLRAIVDIFPGAPMRGDIRRLVDWIASYTLTPPGAVLTMALRTNAFKATRMLQGWRAAELAPETRITTVRRRVLLALAGHLTMSTADLSRAAEASPAVIRAMAEAGLLVPAEIAEPPRFLPPDPDAKNPLLSEDQVSAASALKDAVASREFSVTLLEGVTGSGKTEVYHEAIAECLRQRRQALILLPEIALSAQWLQRFESRFGVPPAVWHSDLTSALRRRTWRAVAEGEAQVVVGARSALFLPFPDLGLIVIDEEHETAFKQEEGVVYNARDMAIVRGRLCQAPVVLVSATPSLETVFNVQSQRYRHLVLPSRHGGASLPDIEIVDLRIDRPARNQFLSALLIGQTRLTLDRGEQAMLFLNRRGYAPLTLCRTCGHRIQCPNCTAWLVEHRARSRLQCHHCGHQISTPAVCPACKAEHSLTAVGPGVERIFDEAKAMFPDARLLVMTSDTMLGPDSVAAAARSIASGEIDLIIGTQMVSKGWHFPLLTLVGVVDADLGLAGGDLRAAEKTIQMLHQVAGRAGRAQKPGRVLLQTFEPEHPVMQALKAGDLARFMQREADQRRPGHWPPFGRLVALIVSSASAEAADEAAGALRRTAPRGDGIVVLGPAPAPLSILRGRHRRRLLLKTRRDIAVQPIIRSWLQATPVSNAVKVDVDVDPLSFL